MNALVPADGDVSNDISAMCEDNLWAMFLAEQGPLPFLCCLSVCVCVCVFPQHAHLRLPIPGAASNHTEDENQDQEVS